MGRKMTIGGKAPQTGYRVSHSHIRSKHQWMPNIQKKSLFSSLLGRFVTITTSTSELRTIDRNGGLDGYLIQADPENLSPAIRKIRTQIVERSQSTPAA